MATLSPRQLGPPIPHGSPSSLPSWAQESNCNLQTKYLNPFILRNASPALTLPKFRSSGDNFMFTTQREGDPRVMANINTKRGVIGILTGGGDVPGLNPAIRGVTLRAIREGYQVIGIRHGWAGLVDMVRAKDYDNSDNFFLRADHVHEAGPAVANAD